MNLIKLMAKVAFLGGTICNPVRAEQVTQLPGVSLAELAGEGSVIVSRVEPGTYSDFQVGDVLHTYIPTGEVIRSLSELSEIANRERADGRIQLIFGVNRNGMVWVASVAMPEQ